MRLRVHVEFVGSDKVKVTKFSGSKTLQIADLSSYKLFDIDTFTITSSQNDTSFCLAFKSGTGTVTAPYEVDVYKRNYDTDRLEIAATVCCVGQREVTVEATLMPRKPKS